MKRVIGLVAVAVLTVLTAGMLVASANHGPVGSHLVAVGPTNPDNGFPAWYRDANGLTLDACLNVADPRCIVGAFDGQRPIEFPGNFPDEIFFSLADATMPMPNNGNALVRVALEGAFSNGTPAVGDQIVFGRIRIRIDNLIPGQTYTVTHPYGTDTFVPDSGGVLSVNFTEDVGAANVGDFTAALNSRIGPFLTWDATAPAPPAGFVGDPGQLHTIAGSPFGTNVFRIEGPGVGALGSPFLCPGNTSGTCVQTDLFRVMGRKATVHGLNIASATYTRDASGAATVDVHASSDLDQVLRTTRQDGLVPTTQLVGAGRSYFARVATTGVPATITVRNLSDDPPTIQTAAVTDRVDITEATYDTATLRLRVSAHSSDDFAPPALTVDGFGPIPSLGTAVFDGVAAPPPVIAVSSAAGGRATRALSITGPGAAPVPVFAHAGIDQSVQQGQLVTLDGGLTDGDVTTWTWTQVAGPPVVITGADTAMPSFAAPALDPPSASALLTFSLTVDGPGGPSSDTVDVTVEPVSAPVANAGPDQVVPRGSLVTLDGSASTGAASFAWTQVAGPAVSLIGATTARPRFTFPNTNSALEFVLTVTGPGGTAQDRVIVAPQPDVLTVTAAEFRTTKREWRITGTASIAGPGNRVTIHIGSTLTGPVLGTADVDPLGAWTFRVTGAALGPDASRTISVESTAGGTLTGVRVTVRN